MPLATPLNPASLSLGAGYLWAAPIGTTEPTDLTAWPAGWVKVGYTFDGSVHTTTYSFQEIIVAEEYDPLFMEADKRKTTVTFDLAEITATNLQRVHNGGTITVGGSAITFDPPAISGSTGLTRIMLGWDAFKADERMIWRKCIQIKPIAVDRKKAPKYAMLTTEYFAEVPGGGLQPFRHILSTTRN
jgi:hypothetical protein